MLPQLLVLLIGFSGPIAGQNAPSRIPDELLRAFRNRQKPRTGYLKYTCTEQMVLHSPLVHCECRFAGDDFFVVRKCEPVQELYIDKHGREKFVPHFSAQSCRLFKDAALDRTLVHDEGRSWGRVQFPVNAPPTYDPRLYGLTWPATRDMHMLLALVDSGNTEFSTERRGHEIRVTRILSPGEPIAPIKTTWIIDLQQGGSVVAIEDSHHQILCTIENKQFDGIWWPFRIRTIHKGRCVERVDFEHVEFDRPQHPPKLDADMLGIPRGATIHDYPKPSDGGKRRTREELVYGGRGRLITPDEWRRTTSQEESERLVTWKHENDRRGEELTKLTAMEHQALESGWIRVCGSPDTWELFVANWLKHHSDALKTCPEPLGEKQVNAAQAILEECRNRARPYAIRQRDMVQKVRETAEKIGGTNSASPGPELIAETESRLMRRSTPELDAIFEELKSRLDDLLTTTQREQMSRSTRSDD